MTFELYTDHSDELKAQKANETVTIPKKEYDSLVEDSKQLSRLDDAGVDNWEYNYMRYQDEDGNIDF